MSRFRESDDPAGRKSGPPQKIANVLSALMARKGYAQVQSALAIADAWEEAAGKKLSVASRAGNLRKGVLEVTVLNSAVMQELTFRKRQLLASLTKLLPDQGIKDLRFRIGHFE
jgi:predicted nucleic acid-binding Zn ribbon protein